MIKDIVIDTKTLNTPCIECPLAFDNVVTDLIDTAKLHKMFCAGLAANQIGYNLRVFVVKIKNKFVPMVNPEYVSKSKSFRIEPEGCLSFPGVSTRKKRHQIIKVKYFDPIKNKQIMCKKMKNFEARVFQHEMDHLDGILI